MKPFNSLEDPSWEGWRAATAVAQRRGGLIPSKTPLKSPLVQGGTLFSSNVAPPGGMLKRSLISPLSPSVSVAI